MIWYRSTATATASGVKPGRMTWVPPTTLRATQPEPSARWNIGALCNKRPLGSRNCPVANAPSAAVMRLVWLSITPLGVPVVPPV